MVSFERIINIPKRGLGNAALKKIDELTNGNISLQAAAQIAVKKELLSNQSKQNLEMLLNLLAQISIFKPKDAIRGIMNTTNYLKYLQKYSNNSMDYKSRLENIEQLIHSASQKKSIVDFLEEAALIQDDHASPENETQEKVVLSTIHAAKGLEYKAVFVVACEEGIHPHQYCMHNADQLEEERRLMYVACTRAESDLYITSACKRGGRFNQPSRFVAELLPG